MCPLAAWRRAHHACLRAWLSTLLVVRLPLSLNFPPLALPPCLPATPPRLRDADPDGLKTLKFLATKWHIAFNSMVVLGLYLSTWM